jgi:PAS domain S-box-containing protein
MKNDKPIVIEELNKSKSGYNFAPDIQNFKSLAYIPISAKEKKAFGVVRIGSQEYERLSPEDKNVLELIGNRIGVAIENANLQKQYIKSEEKYRSLFNNDPNPIFILDADNFTILDTNDRAKEFYGFSRMEMIGRRFQELGDEKDEEVDKVLKKLSSEESILFSKKKHYTRNGRPFYVNINVSRAYYHEREVLIATTTDITESVEKETHLIQAGKMATLGLMAAGMAHEINQPLNVIQICADFILKSMKKGQAVPEEEMQSLAKDIVDNVRRATDVIKHVRDFARMSEVVRNKVNINDPIRDVFKVLGNQIKVHQIDLELDLQPDLPYILAEHNRLEQVFINLVTNAIDAMDEKNETGQEKPAGKKLTITSFAQNGHVVVKVSDTGVGMSREVMDKIFEPFFTTKKIGKGTGLGISISYGIIKDYDGAIGIESEVNRGTTFTLTFPAISEQG